MLFICCSFPDRKELKAVALESISETRCIEAHTRHLTMQYLRGQTGLLLATGVRGFSSKKIGYSSLQGSLSSILFLQQE